jgi:hypothetical protein
MEYVFLNPRDMGVDVDPDAQVQPLDPKPETRNPNSRICRFNLVQC